MINTFLTILTSCIIGATNLVPENYTSIQSAINVSANGDTVSIKSGNYYENNISLLGKDIVVTGRFPNDTTYVRSVIINGNDGSDVSTVFLFNQNEPKTATVQGVTLTNVNNSAEYGGGVRFNSVSSGKIRNCFIHDNSVYEGGGIYIGDDYSQFVSGIVTIENCYISNNLSAREGGGIAIASLPTAIVGNNITNIIVNNCTFVSNERGAIQSWGANFTVTSCVFKNNRSVLSGGAIKTHYANNAIIKNSLFDGNNVVNYLFFAPLGSAVYCVNSNMDIIDDVFENNYFTGNLYSAGTIVFGSSNLGYVNNSPFNLKVERTFAKNNTADQATGFYFFESQYHDLGSVNLYNTFIGDNTSIFGSAILGGNGDFTYNLTNCALSNNPGTTYPVINTPNQTLGLRNTIVWNNSNPNISAHANSTAFYSDIQNGWNYGGLGNINVDPLFVTYGDCTYFLNSGSPCIDTGDPNLFDCVPWPIGYSELRSDMGIYGGPTACPVECLN